MYCIKCGVKLADTEKKCPLCDTVVCHPDFPSSNEAPLYPEGKMPRGGSGTKALCGAVIIMFLLPLTICFFADFLYNGILDWFGYVAGALLVSYVSFALPAWFERPNPVIFTPCSFAALTLYLLYIELYTGGAWFLSFAFPVVGGVCLITSAVVTLVRYLRRGRLYIAGGAFIASGAFALLVEFLAGITFGLRFVGWSVYTSVTLVMLGCLLIYIAINPRVREIIERKLFF
ncbi:MAG: hypothetical protein E7671_03485 [Ruminococcaceae bacterium]|nr:hypothetical protein [Oscillospiraceae bacterium]